MKSFKYAILYLINNKKKSMLLFIVLLVITASLLTSFAIKRTTNDLSSNLQSVTGASFAIEIDLNNPDNFTSNGSYNQYTGNFITEQTINEIMQTEGIAGNNAQVEYPADVFFEKGDEGLSLIKKSEKFDHDSYFDYLVLLKISTNTKFDQNFLGGMFELIEGEHIDGSNAGKALISEELAKENDLNVGDTLVLKQNPEEVQGDKLNTKSVEVAGIYKILATQPNTDSLPACYLMENFIFTGNDVLSVLEGVEEGEIATYEKIEFFVENPQELGEIIEAVKEIEGVEWGDFLFTTNDKAYQQSSNSMENLNELMTTMIYMVIVIGTVILALILYMWIRNRKREFGILISLGISKVRIILQNMLEVGLLLVLVFSVMFLLSGNISEEISKYLQGQNSNAVEENVNENLYPWESQLQSENIGEDIDVLILTEDMIWSYGISIIIVLSATIVSILPILSQKPREILTKL